MRKRNCRWGLAPLSILFLSLILITAHSWNWKIFDDDDDDDKFDAQWKPQEEKYMPNEHSDHATDFDTETLDNPKGRELVQKVRAGILSKKNDVTMIGSCWQNGYSQLFSNCKQIMENEDLKSRLALLLSDCFVKESGRPPLPYCSPKTPVNNCLALLDNHNHQVYLSFFIDSHAMCHHLQSQAFRIEIEKVVNNLKTSTNLAVDKLWKIEQKSDALLDQSGFIQESLGFVESKTEFIAKNSKEVEDKILNVMNRSDAIFQQSNEIIDSQSRLREEQSRMQKSIDKNMAELQESYKTLGDSIGSLQTLTEDAHLRIQENIDKSMMEIQKSYSKLADSVGFLQSLTEQAHLRMKEKIESSMIEIQKSYLVLGENIGSLQTVALETQSRLNDVAMKMSTQLEKIQIKADDIGNAVSFSLEQQKELLSGQSLALQGLDSLTQAQAEAFEQSRLSLQTLAEDARRNQLEFMSYQTELLDAHNRLAKSSNANLLAQESFESKQTNMLMALEKLFSLYNSVLMESRSMKAFFFYLAMTFVLYMLTSTKQTNHVRASLYFGLCTSFAIECLLMRFEGNISNQGWIASRIFYIRITYITVALIYLISSLIRYRSVLCVSNISNQGWIASRIFYIRITYITVALIYLISSLIRYRDYELLNYKLLLDIQEKMKLFDPKMDRNGSSLFRKQLLTCGRGKQDLMFSKRRPKVGGSQGCSTVPFLDATFEDETSDDPDYYPSSEDE